MSWYLPQLSRPGGSGSCRTTQARHQGNETETQLNKSPTADFQEQQQGDQDESHVAQASVSSLLEWHVTTAAGLREKEETLRMEQNLAERQKNKIEKLRKSNEVLSTDLESRKEENMRFTECLESSKEEVEIMAKQVKSVSFQLKRIIGERLEATMVKEERNKELQQITESLKQLQLGQLRKVEGWEDKLKKEEKEIGIMKENTEKVKDGFMKELQALDAKMRVLDETIVTSTGKIASKEADVKIIDTKIESTKEDIESTKLSILATMEKTSSLKNVLEKKMSEFEVRERDMCLKSEEIDACIENVQSSSREKVAIVAEKEDEVKGLDKAVREMKDTIANLEEKKITNKSNLMDNEQSLDTYRKKVDDIQQMRTEIRALNEELKISDEKKCTAEKELKDLGDVQLEKDNLEDENQKLSQEVHEYEDKVKNCKSGVAFIQEGVKEKLKTIGLMEVKVQEMEVGVKNKTKQVEKVKAVAEAHGKSLTGSKMSSSELRVKLKGLELERESRSNDCEKRRMCIEDSKRELEKLKGNAKSLKLELQEANSASKIIDKEYLCTDENVAGISDELKNLDLEVGNAEEVNLNLTQCVKSGQDTVDDMKKELKLLIDEGLKLEKEKNLAENKFQNVTESNEKVKVENEILKKNIRDMEGEIKGSVDRIENSKSIKNSLTVKTDDVKNLEEELKNVKESQVTASKRKDKLVRQHEKNQGTLKALEVDIVKGDQNLNMAQETLENVRVKKLDLLNVKIVREKALEVANTDLEKLVAEFDKLTSIVEGSKSKLNEGISSKDKLLSDMNKAAHELRGLLVLKDREHDEMQAKASKEVTELEVVLCAKKNDLEAKSNPVKSDSVEESFSQEKELIDITKQCEGVKEELSKFEVKLADKKLDVDRLQVQLQTLKNIPNQKARAPLGSISLLSNGGTTKTHQGSVTSSSRKDRTLLGSGKGVQPSPVRSFLAPPGRSTPSSRYSKKKPMKKSRGKTPPPPPIVDFDSVMGVSDDMDSS